MSQLAKKRRRPPDFYLCIAPKEKSAVVEFITTGSNALGEAHFHLCLHCQSLIMAGATAMRDKCVAKVKEVQRNCEQTPTTSEDYEYDQAVAWRLAGIVNELESLTLGQVKPGEM